MPFDGLTVQLGLRADGAVNAVTVDARAGEVTARLLRQIPLGELASMARRRPQVTYEREQSDMLVQELRFEREQAPRPGRRGRSDRYYYADLAVRYEQWIETGRPLRVLADDVYLSEPGLRTALRTARDRGMLTEAARGRAGGQATEKARKLLEQEGD